jgi:hypothetical protein
MATPTIPTRSSLMQKKAELAKQAQMKMRVASAYTIAKTMLPKAPAPVQLKFAKNLLINSTPILASVLRQTSVNSYNTRLAAQFEDVNKTSLNDFLENPSVLSKEEAGLKAELNGDPKNAASKRSDVTQTKDKLFKDDGRKEPEGMEASKSEVGKIDGLNDDKKLKEAAAKKLKDAADQKLREAADQKLKEAAAKKACGKGCKGCAWCKKADAKKKAEGEKPAPFPPADAAAAPVEGDAAAAPVEDVPAEDAPVEDAPAEGEDAAEDAPEGDEPEGEGDDTEKFDAEIADLEDTIEDTKDDIEKIQDQIEAVVDAADGVEVGEAEVADGVSDLDQVLSEDGAVDGAADGEVPEIPAGEGEELDLASIFNNDTMNEKVSALSGETTAAADETGFLEHDDFFGPSDPSDLEVALDQEEALSDPASMFAAEGEGDPLAALFGKAAAADTDVVRPGAVEDYFETDLSGEDRDADSDHEDLLGAAIDSVKQPVRDDSRSKEEEPKLEEPKQAKKHIRSLHPQAPKQAAGGVKMSSRDIASALFLEDE